MVTPRVQLEESYELTLAGFMPHPVLLFMFGEKPQNPTKKNNQQTEKTHNVHYWKRSKIAHDQFGGAGNFLLPHRCGEKNVGSH